LLKKIEKSFKFSR